MIIVDGIELYSYQSGKLHPQGVITAKAHFCPSSCEECGVGFEDIELNHIHLHHIDEDNTNNDKTNWTFICVTCHMREHKTGNTFNKGKRKATRFGEEDIAIICDMYESFEHSYVSIAKVMECDKKTIGALINRHRPELPSLVHSHHRSKTCASNNRKRVS